MPGDTFRVRFVDLDVSVQAPADCTLLDVCLEHDLPMETACGGFAVCNSCRVLVIDGRLSEMDEVEAPFLDAPGQRLGCQARVVADVVCRMDPGDL